MLDDSLPVEEVGRHSWLLLLLLFGGEVGEFVVLLAVESLDGVDSCDTVTLEELTN